MENDKIKEFSEIPKDAKINIHEPNSEWCFGRGGYGLKDNQWHIDHVNKDLSAEIYVFPDYLNKIIHIIQKNAKQEKLEEIKRALEIIP